MSSSERRAAGRRFLALLFAGLTLMLGGVIALTAITDPSGLLVGGGWSPGVCAQGMKDRHPSFMAAWIRRNQPDEIIIGTSRVRRGFEHGGLTPARNRTAMNLGYSGASLADIDAITRQAIVDAPIQRVWIGLDFGSFATTDRARRPAAMGRRWATAQQDALFTGLLSAQALQATREILRHPGTCAVAPFDTRGFPNPAAEPFEASHRANLPGKMVRAGILASWLRSPAEREALYTGELARFTRLLSDMERQGMTVVLFVGPTHPAYDSLIAEAGLSQMRIRWRTDVARIADAYGVVLVSADRPGFLADLPGLAEGCDTAPADCAFYDATHFRPVVGKAIIAEGRRLSEARHHDK
tara:strand:+ start:4280 stop:5344 length:1065 start_codon:yes stop_codon:yes gene_type:complete